MNDGLGIVMDKLGISDDSAIDSKCYSKDEFKVILTDITNYLARKFYS